MPKYIDIEKLTITGVPLYDEDLDYMVSMRDLRNALMMMPGEKVVSKATYEKLKTELVAMRGAATSLKIHYENEKKETSLEIFREIVKIIKRFDAREIVVTDMILEIYRFMNKYTEGCDK